MAEVTLKSFLNNDPRVKAARKKLTAASAELSKQKAALASAKGIVSAAQLEVIQNRVDAAQQAFNDAKRIAQEAETSRTQYFNINQKEVQSKAQTKDINKAKDELQELLTLKQSQPNNQILDARIALLNDQINQTGKFTPKPEQKNVENKAVGDQQETVGVRDYASEVNNAARIVRNMSTKEREDLATVLKASKFYDGPIIGVYSDTVVGAYQAAIAANQARSLAWGEEVPWAQFISDKTAEVQASGLGGAGGPQVSGTISYSTPQEARARVEKIFEAELGRLPTAEELDKFVNDLLAREKKASAIQKTTTRKVGGMTLTEYDKGLDRDQFLTEKIRKLPEYEKRKAEGRSLSVQTLQGTANANGVSLTPAQLEQFAIEVQNGKDIKVIQNQIRMLAGLGMPESIKSLLSEGVDLDTIYSPYRKAMASILEINPETIPLNDSVLRNAIGPNGEMSLYDFQRQLRQDPRWQYTDNAREEVSNIALRVLQDFGFQG